MCLRLLDRLARPGIRPRPHRAHGRWLGTGQDRRGDGRVPGHPVRGPARRRAALAAPATRRALAQLVAPGARGLFQRAIVESGTYDLAQPSLASAESSGAAFAAKVGCAGNTAASTAACLRRLPVSGILETEDTSGYYPNIDSAVLPRSIGTALAGGQFSHVPVIIGTNHDEWRSFIGQDQLYGATPVTAANYVTDISSTLSLPASRASVVAKEYPLSRYSSPAVALGAVGTDAIFACPSLVAEKTCPSTRRPTPTSSTTRTRPTTTCPPSGSRTGRRTRSSFSTCSAWATPPTRAPCRGRSSSWHRS